MTKPSSSSAAPSGAVFRATLVALVTGFGVYFDHEAGPMARVPDTIAALHADLARESASPEVRRVAQWAVGTQDHGGLPFVVVDKARARLFAFDPQGRFRGSTPVLLGASRGDGTTAPATPAGRFVADTWQSAQGDRIVWVNADTSLFLHSLPSDSAPGRGVQRLESDQIDDKRISDGSLHVAGNFYRQYLSPLKGQGSIAYVLPEFLPVQEVFSSRDSGARRPS